MIITSQYPCPHVPDVSVPDYVLRHAPRLHDRPALVDGTARRTVTYGELADTVRRVGTGLSERGLGTGDVLALYSPNLLDYPAAVLSVASPGGVVSPGSHL